jgi:hypothetical protein
MIFIGFLFLAFAAPVPAVALIGPAVYTTKVRRETALRVLGQLAQHTGFVGSDAYTRYPQVH